MNVPFFGTKRDLMMLAAGVEDEAELLYAPAGRFLVNRVKTYRSAREIPDFGVTTARSAVGSPRFLVVPLGTNIVTQRVDQFDGTVSFHINQLYNPTSVVFQPGGEFDKQILISGSIATCSKHTASRQLQRLFARHIKRQFTKVRADYVGPEALVALKRGDRLVTSVDSPREYDLSL